MGVAVFIGETLGEADALLGLVGETIFKSEAKLVLEGETVDTTVGCTEDFRTESGCETGFGSGSEETTVAVESVCLDEKSVSIAASNSVNLDSSTSSLSWL